MSDENTPEEGTKEEASGEPLQDSKTVVPTRSGFKRTFLFNHLPAKTYLFLINFLLKNNGEYTKVIEFLKQNDPEIGDKTPQEARKEIKDLYKVCRLVPVGRFLFNEKAWFMRMSKNLFIQEDLPQVILKKSGNNFIVREQPDLAKMPDSFDPLNAMFEALAVTRERMNDLLTEERMWRERWKSLSDAEKQLPENALSNVISSTLTKLISEYNEYSKETHKAMLERGFLTQVPKKITVDAFLRGASEAYNKYIQSTESNSKLLSILNSTVLSDMDRASLKVEGDDYGQKENIPSQPKTTGSS